MPDDRKPIPPLPPRWKPNPDPMSIEIPGLDTTASPQDQIEQIEQLITLKLQNIDENFAKAHHILSSRILPAVKRFAVGTEPVREAAKFWVSFYEQAAQIRIPTFEEYATVNEDESSEEKSVEPTETSAIDDGQDHSLSSAESSFAPGQAAFSSTPAGDRAAHLSDDPSWSATSLESPIVRLNREIQNFSQDADETESSTITGFEDSLTPSKSTISIDKGKGKQREEPLRQNLLRQSIYTSPLRPRSNRKVKTPVPKDLNPFIPPGSNPSKWDGLVDLREASTTTPQKYSRRLREPRFYQKPVTPAKEAGDDDYDYDSDDIDGYPPGMSPPVLMSPARPLSTMRAKPSVKLGQTPKKDAAARIMQDIVADVQGKPHPSSRPLTSRSIFTSHGVTDSSLSTVSTPSLSRYNMSSGLGTDSSLESMMRQVGLRDPIPQRHQHGWESEDQSVAAPGPTFSSQAEQQAGPSSAYNTRNDQYPVQDDPYYNDDGFDDDSDSDDDVVNDTAHPSAAFLMASQTRRPMSDDDDDDSFEDSMVMGQGGDDSFDPGNLLSGGIPVHPFARLGGVHVSVEDDSFDDSFDNDIGRNAGGMGLAHGEEEETLFGVPPAQREQRIGMGGGGRSSGGGGLMLHGGDLIDTSHLTEELGKAADSPTPAGGSRDRK